MRHNLSCTVTDCTHNIKYVCSYMTASFEGAENTDKTCDGYIEKTVEIEFSILELRALVLALQLGVPVQDNFEKTILKQQGESLPLYIMKTVHQRLCNIAEKNSIDLKTGGTY